MEKVPHGCDEKMGYQTPESLTKVEFCPRTNQCPVTPDLTPTSNPNQNRKAANRCASALMHITNESSVLGVLPYVAFLTHNG
jgi:hypothetical protein